MWFSQKGKHFKKRNKETGFGYIEIDLMNKKTVSKVFCFNSNEYDIEFEDTFELTHKIKRKFVLNSDFERKHRHVKHTIKAL